MSASIRDSCNELKAAGRKPASIPNYGAGLKQAKNSADGEIKALHIKKLFRMIVLSPSGGGKTNLLYHMLKNSPNTFAHLHICARNPDQPLYDDLRDKLNGFITFYDPDNMPSVNEVRKSKSANGIELVVFDDLSSEKNLQRNVIGPYYYRGRHMKLSMIMLAHSFFALDKMIRLNSEYCFILKANAKRDLKMILKDFNVDASEENFYEIYKRATQSIGQGMLIDSGRNQIRYNFDVVVDGQTLDMRRLNK